MTVSASHLDPGLDGRLAARTLDLVNIASVSGDEAAILTSIEAALPPGLDVVDRDDAVLFAIPSPRRDGVPADRRSWATSTRFRRTGTSPVRGTAMRSSVEVPPT